MHGIQAFATRRRESSIALPGKHLLGILRTTRHHFAASQAFPGPKVCLTEIIQNLYGQTVSARNRQRRLIGTLARTAVDGGNRQDGQRPGKLHSLRLPMLGKGIIAGPDIAKFTIGYCLAMAHENEAGRKQQFVQLVTLLPGAIQALSLADQYSCTTTPFTVSRIPSQMSPISHQFMELALHRPGASIW